MKKLFFSSFHQLLSDFQTHTFFVIAGILILISKSLNLAYQDAWILEFVWPILLLIFLLYIVIAFTETNLLRFTVISSVLVFLMYYVPGVKYLFIYGSTVDVSVHLSFTQHIVSTGDITVVEPYSYAPGFHAINAVLAQLSSLPPDTWLRLTPALFAVIFPLGIYILTKEHQTPAELSKLLIALSVFCLPSLYLLNGTSFAIFLLFTFLCFLVFREQANGSTKLIYSVLLIFSVVTLIFWHPSTCIITFGMFMGLGLLMRSIKLFEGEAEFFGNAYKIGILGVVVTLFYWMYKADYIWEKMIKNLYLLFNADSLDSALIPSTFFKLDLLDRIITLLLMHSRDFLFIGLGLIGTAMLILQSRLHNKKPESLCFRIYPFFIGFFILLAFIFFIQFSSQGYRRFLFYVVTFAIFPAGYFIWNLFLWLQKTLPAPLSQGLKVVITTFALLIVLFQIYPYQPLIATSPDGNYSNPQVWLHQVNTINQYYALNYIAYRKPEILESFWIDYVGQKQAKIFFNYEIFSQVANVKYAIDTPGYILLHYPGKGGAYVEQLFNRTYEKIDSWRYYANMNTIYDNGLSFVLYYPFKLNSLSILNENVSAE